MPGFGAKVEIRRVTSHVRPRLGATTHRTKEFGWKALGVRHQRGFGARGPTLMQRRRRFLSPRPIRLGIEASKCVAVFAKVMEFSLPRRGKSNFPTRILLGP